jgi:hypothetical protein
MHGGGTVGYTAGRHFYNLPDGLDMVELWNSSGKSLFLNDFLMSVGIYFCFPPAPPYAITKAANNIQLAAFFFGKSMGYSAVAYKGCY